MMAHNAPGLRNGFLRVSQQPGAQQLASKHGTLKRLELGKPLG